MPAQLSLAPSREHDLPLPPFSPPAGVGPGVLAVGFVAGFPFVAGLSFVAGFPFVAGLSFVTGFSFVTGLASSFVSL